jgi:anti-sigma regulatory factor (Ser/Thr protein kinase)
MPLMLLRVPCDDEAPAAARRAVARLRSLAAVIDDLTLIASELVTNAVLYSGCDEHDEIELRLDRTNQDILVSVLDPKRSGKSAKLAIDEQRSVGGMGLLVVERLASRWGRDQSRGYRLWARVPLATRSA